MVAAGLDPANLPERVTIEAADQMHGSGASGPRRWRDVWSTGHSISGVTGVMSAAELIEQTAQEYEAAKRATLENLGR
jgi:nitronate monooxygenase